MGYEKLRLENGVVLNADHLAHIEEGISDASEFSVYCAEYGVTTYAEIKAAVDAGKLCFCKRDNILVPLYDVTSARIRFINATPTLNVWYYAVTSANSWSNSGYALQGISGRVQTINSASTSTSYPSTKAVYDFVHPIETELGEKVSFWEEQDLTEEQKAQARKNIGASARDCDNYIVNYCFDDDTGTNYTAIRVFKNKIDGSKQYPFVYVPNGTGIPQNSALDIARADGWLLAINAGIGGTVGAPHGTLIQNGEVIVQGPTSHHPTNLPLTIDTNGDLWYAAADADAEAMVADDIVSAVCGFMPIIKNFEAIPSNEWNECDHYTLQAQRQIIGQYANGDYAVITCEGRSFNNSPGWTIEQAQNICIGMGLKFAYNLDGGGSTEIVYGLKQLNLIYEGTTGRKVPAFIVFNGTTSFDSPEADDTDGAYTFVEYLQLDGNQYIKTSIPETEIYSYECKVLNENINDKSGHIMSSVNVFMPFYKWVDSSTTDKVNLLATFKGTQTKANVTCDPDDPHVIYTEVHNNKVNVYFDGSLAFEAPIGSTAVASNRYHLFAYGNPDMAIYRFTGKFYYLNLRDADGNMKYSFHPAIRNSDGVYGLYDTVNDVFHVSNTNYAFSGA